MKQIFLLLMILSSVAGHAQLSNYCRTTNNNPDAEFCARMKHLRATVNVFDQQREMALVNFKYLNLMGQSLKDNSERIEVVVPTELSQHKATLQSLASMGGQIADLSKSKNPEALVVANRVSNMCLSCHATSNPRPGASGWNEVNSVDWRRITADCAEPGRNPYLCRSMYSMATSYSHFSTAVGANIKNYAVTAGVATEVLRILKLLGAYNFLHGSEQFRTTAEAEAKEILLMAKQENPAVFEKSLNLTNACTSCHTSRVRAPAELNIPKWN